MEKVYIAQSKRNPFRKRPKRIIAGLKFASSTRPMRNIFIIHGSYGNPEENWFPWLKEKFENLGQRVFVPQFPIPRQTDASYGGHILKEWLKTLEQYKQYINSETIFVAHSRGCVFLYHVLAGLSQPVHAVFLVGPWLTYHWYEGKPKSYVDSFHETPFDWERIKRGSKYFEIFQSTNDEISVDEGKKIAEHLGATLTVVKNAGHFNIARDPKYKTFELLFNHIKQQL